MSITKLHTAHDLLELGRDAWFELVEGELREVTPSSHGSSRIGLRIAAPLFAFVETHQLGAVTGEAGGYALSCDPDTVVAPDAGFVAARNLSDGWLADRYLPIPPDFAAEIMSPTDRLVELERKVQQYLAAGIALVWLVKTSTREVVVFQQGQPPFTVSSDGTLDGGDVLPGFRLAVADVFT